MEDILRTMFKEQGTRLLKDFVNFLIHHKLVDNTVYNQIYVFTELDKHMPFQIEEIRGYIDKRIVDKKVSLDYDLAKFWQQVVIEGAKHSDMPEIIADNAVKKFKEQFLNDN